MEKPFSNISSVKPSSNLIFRVNERIEAARKQAMLKRMVAFGFLELVSAASVVASFVYIVGSLKASGMFSYISLVFTDVASLAYSKELVLSVLESMPAFSIALALSACALLAWSTARIIRMSKVRTHYA